MKTPLRFLKKTALAAIFASSAASVCAATSSTQPRLNWFSETATAATATAGAWSGDDRIIENNVAEIDGETIYTPTNNSTTNATVKVTVSFSTLPSELPSTDMTGAQAAITAAATNGTPAAYYVYGKESAGDTATWIGVSGFTPVAEANVDVTIDIDYETGKATYVIGDTVAANVYLANVPATRVSSLTFAGNGTISGTILGTKGTATHCIGNANYGSYADALAAAIENGGSIQSWSGDAANGWTSAATAGTGVGTGTVADPFEIPNLDALKAFQSLVATTNCAGLYFRQTADIALDAPWPGIGLQNGKDILNGDSTASPPIVADPAAFGAAAFCGTYDGGNFTVSNFQMAGGNLDYCGFFNSISGATIKNLKIAYKENKFASDTSGSTTESGATFVGVATNSTLRNLTTVAGTVPSVSCGKGFGGIVGYLTAGSTVDSCTNNINLTSLKTNKAGGIAMITQGGTGTAVITNCLNNGSTTGNATQKGGIVGYVGVATTIADCTDTAGSTPSFLHHQTGTLTLSGENKAPASVVSYTKNATFIDGLQYATVSDSTATFVKNADLAASSAGSPVPTYKVMGPNNASVTLQNAGDSIAFDSALTAFAGTVAGATGLDVTSSTSGTVTTYTATARKYPAVYLK